MTGEYIPTCDYCDRAAVARIPDDMTDDTANVCPDHLRGVSVDDIVAVFTGFIWTDDTRLLNAVLRRAGQITA